MNAQVCQGDAISARWHRHGSARIADILGWPRRG